MAFSFGSKQFKHLNNLFKDNSSSFTKLLNVSFSMIFDVDDCVSLAISIGSLSAISMIGVGGTANNFHELKSVIGGVRIFRKSDDSRCYV